MHFKSCICLGKCILSPICLGRCILSRRNNKCKLVSPEIIYTGNITQTEQVIFRNAYLDTYTYRHVIAIDERRANKLEREQGKDGYTGGFGG